MEGHNHDINHLIQEHRQMKKRQGVFRLLFPIVTVGIIVGFMVMIARDVQSLDTDALAGHLEQEASRLAPRLQEHLADVAAKLEPVYAEEMARQSKALAPKLEKLLVKESETLKSRVAEQFEGELDKAMKETESRQRAVLVQYLPELKGDRKAQDRVLAAVRTSLLKWSMRQLTHTFNEHMVAMEQIRRTLQTGYRQAPGDKAASNPDDVLMLWLELMGETIGGDDTVLGEPGDQASAKIVKKARARTSR